MARMRTIKDAIEIIKNDDPNTAFTKNALRRLVLSDVIPHTAVGKKRLIDVDLLEKYLKGEYTPAPKVEPFERGRVRRISG